MTALFDGKTEALAEQVAKIKVGDHVRAQFQVIDDDYVIEGVTRLDSGCLALGPRLLSAEAYLVKIIEHTPAKPAWHSAKVVKAHLAGDFLRGDHYLIRTAETHPVFRDNCGSTWNADQLSDVEVIVP